jgi:hypothetical protein
MLDHRVLEKPAVLRIGGIAFDARASALPLDEGLDPAYAAFVAAAPQDGDEVIAVDLVRGDADPPEGARQLSSGEASWSAYSLEDGDQAIALAPASGPAWWARFDRAVTRVRVTCGPLLWNKGVFYSPMRYPLDQLLMMYRLAAEGAVIHCAVVAIGDRAVLCPGVSGAGKTTLTRQLTGCAGVRVLSDDRAIVRCGPTGYRAYGTPWPGEGGQAVNEGLPLAAIAFLEQGQRAMTRPISLPEAMKRIARVSSVPWYDRTAGPRVFDGLTALCSAVPTSVLTFAPDPSVAPFVVTLSGAVATLLPS